MEIVYSNNKWVTLYINTISLYTRDGANIRADLSIKSILSLVYFLEWNAP